MMVPVLVWLAYFVPVAAMGVGIMYRFLTSVPTIAARVIAQHRPPPGVVLDPASAQAIHDELDRRKRAGVYTGAVIYCLTIAALHPMYTPERLSSTAGASAYVVALVGGFTIGETYVATVAARRPRTSRRVASLAPRTTATYLSTTQRLLQIGLLAVIAAGTVVLTALVIADGSAWAVPAMVGCWVWLAGIAAAFAAQRFVLAAPVPLEDDRPLVREFATASAMQLLHRFCWGLGIVVYLMGVSIGIGLHPDLLTMVVSYLPVVAISVAAYWIPRLLHSSDPFWHFARATGSAA